MTLNNRKNGAQSAVIDRAIKVGLQQAAASGSEAEVKVVLTNAQAKRVTELCNLLGLSARSVLNAALRYTLHLARLRRVPPSQLKEVPKKRLSGQEVTFTLTADTVSKLREADAFDLVPACTAAGIGLLHERLLKKAKSGVR